jgi:L-ascorbate metabolism protein UlaG (beta-lactamase superfamily)
MTWPPSDHFNGKTFFNPGETDEGGLIDLIKWKATAKPVPWPEHIPVDRRPAPPAPTGDGVTATWIGHATFLLRSATCTVLTDPMFSDVAGPLSWLGARRAAPPAMDIADVPRVDLILLSHDHYDHCDLPSLRRLAERDDPVVVAPLGHAKLLGAAGVRRTIELDWWAGCTPVPGAEVTLVPALHWCRRSPFATNVRLWGGFMLRTGGRLVYFAGDSGYRQGLFPEIGRRLGAPDLSLIPIGAYEPRWFMKDAHMNPAEAVRVHREVGSRRSVAMHWGTFQLTDEGRDDPVRDLKAACAPGDAFEAVELGDSIFI